MGELPIAESAASLRDPAEKAVLRLIEITSRQHQTQRTLLDWLRVEYEIEKPSNKLLAVAELDSDTWVGKVKRIRGKKLPLTAAGVRGFREGYTRSIEPARSLTLKPERTLCHGIPSLPLRRANKELYFFDKLLSRNSAASALISVKSRCISLQPYHSA
jgi:hypothetical protein